MAILHKLEWVYPGEVMFHVKGGAFDMEVFSIPVKEFIEMFEKGKITINDFPDFELEIHKHYSSAKP
ncbi:MAG: hypothetical protein ABIH82_06120 [Candidatus Woesearchaeota archaeon]